MSGHSKWATIKRKKGALDAKKGKVFTKLVREVTTAARLGGGDSAGNPRLRAAVIAAKAARMPADNIERAIKKGTGALEGPPLEEIVYEGYGPGGVALYVEAQTDNRNRTSSEVKASFAKAGGNLGTPGSVAWMFQKRGQLVFDKQLYADKAQAERLLDVVLEAGASDVVEEAQSWQVTCEPRLFNNLLDALEAANLVCENAEVTMFPDSTVKLSGVEAEKTLRLVERLDDLDDVQRVYGNFDIDEAELERLAALSP